MDAITEWYARGYQYASDRQTGSTHLLRVSCPECGAGVRVQGALSEICAAGCGWERWRKEQ